VIEGLKRIPITCLITPGNLTPRDFETQKNASLDQILAAAATGINLVQLREKKLPARFLFRIAKELADALKGTRCSLLVNERLDVAVAAGAHGVHLTSTSIPPAKVRAIAPKGFVIGVSTHSGSEVLRARDSGADYAVYGPVFPTPGKADQSSAKGTEELRAVCAAASPFPVLALGGISRSNYRSAIDSGASGIAAISLFEDIEQAAEAIEGLGRINENFGK